MTENRVAYGRITRTADNVLYLIERGYMAALWTSDPELYALGAQAAFERLADPSAEVEMVGDATLFCKNKGATFSGWVVKAGPRNSDQIRYKSAALELLGEMVAEQFAEAGEAPPAAEQEPARGEAVALDGRRGVWLVAHEINHAARDRDERLGFARQIFTGGDELGAAVFTAVDLVPFDPSASEAPAGTLGIFLTDVKRSLVVPIPHEHAGDDAPALVERVRRWQRRTNIYADAALVVRMRDYWVDGRGRNLMAATRRPDHEREALKVYAEKINAGAAVLPPVVSPELAGLIAGKLGAGEPLVDLVESGGHLVEIEVAPASPVEAVLAAVKRLDGARYIGTELEAEVDAVLTRIEQDTEAEQPARRPAEDGDKLVHPRPAPVEACPSPVDASPAPALPQVDDSAPLGRRDLVTYNGIRYVIIRADSMAALARGEGQIELYPGNTLPDRISSGERGHWVEASACSRRLVLEWGVRHRDPVTGAPSVIAHPGRAFAEFGVEVGRALGERSAELVARAPGGEWVPAPMRTAAEREAEAARYLAALD